MSRLISVALTEESVVARTKTETRRLGWWKDKNGRRLLNVGDRLMLCRKVMGRRHACRECDGLGRPWTGEPKCETCGDIGLVTDPLERLAEVEVTEVRREPLLKITEEGVVREGVAVLDEHGRRRFSEWDTETGQPTPQAWVEWFCEEMGCTPATEVTVIQWRYLDTEGAQP